MTAQSSSIFIVRSPQFLQKETGSARSVTCRQIYVSFRLYERWHVARGLRLTFLSVTELSDEWSVQAEGDIYLSSSRGDIFWCKVTDGTKCKHIRLIMLTCMQNKQNQCFHLKVNRQQQLVHFSKNNRGYLQSRSSLVSAPEYKTGN